MCSQAKQRCNTILLLMAMLLAFSPGGLADRMPCGSFLVKPARSVAQLTIQVKTTPKVAHRYAIHFRVSASQFAHYAQSHLGLRPLPRGGKYRVFFIKPDGRIGSRVRYLHKGTSVFLYLPSGQPVLLGSCGNPLTARLPGYIPPRATAAPSPITIPPIAPPLEPPAATMFFELPQPPASLPPETVALPLWQAVPALSLLAPEIPPAPPAHRLRPGLTPLLLIGLLGVLEGGGKPANPPPVIPDPASVASLAMAVALLIACEQRRRSRRH